MDVPRLKRHHLVGFVHGGSTFQAPTHYKYNYDLKGTLYMYLEYELGNIYTFTIGILPSWAIRGYQLVRYPCQEGDHHARGHPAGLLYPWQEGLNSSELSVYCCS